MTVFRYDQKLQKLVPVLPKVKIGFERLKGTSRLSSGLVVCDQHGTVKQCWVHWSGALVSCCRACIVENCQVVRALLRPNWHDEDPGSEGPLMDNPAGHSY